MLEHIPYPKQPRRLPTVLSEEEVARLIDSQRHLRAVANPLESLRVSDPSDVKRSRKLQKR